MSIDTFWILKDLRFFSAISNIMIIQKEINYSDKRRDLRLVETNLEPK